MKITVLLRKDSDEIKGEMIAAHNRTKQLICNFPDAEINTIVIREYIHPFLQLLRKCPIVKKNKTLDYDGLHYKAIWFNFSIVDNILVKMHRNPIFIYKKLDGIIEFLKDSDIIIAHSLYAGYIAMKAKEKYKIPYTVTWHGSDIHTVPETNMHLRELTIRIMQNAENNHFVSMDLLCKSNRLCLTDNKSVLYNGVDRKKFYRFTDKEILRTKEMYGINFDKKNIAFLGNFYNVKNILSLPEIFKYVNEHIDIVCHFVGDGPLKGELIHRCNDCKIDYRLWGNQPSSEIPAIINCMDMVVLPSFNEGLPLVSLETLACGIPMVGSRVGGIPEAIGEENTVELNCQFVDNMANLIINRLHNSLSVNVKDDFSWEFSGKKEYEIIKSIFAHT